MEPILVSDPTDRPRPRRQSRRRGEPAAAGRTARLGVALGAAAASVGHACHNAAGRGGAAATEQELARFTRDLVPGAPLVEQIELPPACPRRNCWRRSPGKAARKSSRIGRVPGRPVKPPPAVEPPPPEEVASTTSFTHRAAPGAVSPRHPLPDALLARALAATA